MIIIRRKKSGNITEKHELYESCLPSRTLEFENGIRLIIKKELVYIQWIYVDTPLPGIIIIIVIVVLYAPNGVSSTDLQAN